MNIIGFMNAISLQDEKLDKCIGENYEDLSQLYNALKGLPLDVAIAGISKGVLEDSKLSFNIQFKDWDSLKKAKELLVDQLTGTSFTFLLKPLDGGIYFLECEI